MRHYDVLDNSQGHYKKKKIITNISHEHRQKYLTEY